MHFSLCKRSAVSRSLKLINGVSSRRFFHPSPAALKLYKNVDAKAFKTRALGSNERIALVDFYADWCGPCRMLSPILEKLGSSESTESGSGLPVDVVTIDTETADGGNLARSYGVTGLPTVIAFRDGKEITRFIGALPEPAIRAVLEKV